MSRSNKGTSIVADTIVGLAWPLVAVLVVFILRAPLIQIAKHIAENLGDTQEIDAGPVKLQFSKSKAQEIQAPPADVATALASLDSDGISLLLSLNPGIPWISCIKADLGSNFSVSSLRQIANVGELIRFKFLDSQPNGTFIAGCRQEDVRINTLSTDGVLARTYLLKLVATSISVSVNSK